MALAFVFCFIQINWWWWWWWSTWLGTRNSLGCSDNGPSCGQTDTHADRVGHRHAVWQWRSLIACSIASHQCFRNGLCICLCAKYLKTYQLILVIFSRKNVHAHDACGRVKSISFWRGSGFFFSQIPDHFPFLLLFSYIGRKLQHLAVFISASYWTDFDETKTDGRVKSRSINGRLDCGIDCNCFVICYCNSSIDSVDNKTWQSSVEVRTVYRLVTV